MHVEPRPLMAWTRDLALAYAGGLAVGAPFALAAVWLTGIERAATACLLLAMALFFVVLRRSPSRMREHAPLAAAPAAPNAASRRVA